MAEDVYSNYRTICKAAIHCTCGANSIIRIKPASGGGSQRVHAHQCPSCGKVTALTVFGGGLIKGEGVRQRA